MSIKTLLVDDERSLLEQAEMFLEREGEIEVQTVPSAVKALNLIGEEDFDVIVSDYQMPEMDGLEFLEELREERDCDIPFIMFTGKGREEVAMNALNLGADRYLQKGGDPKAQYEVLAQTIKQEFEHRGAEEKIVELNSLLRSLSNVNRLIGEEDDLKTLMEKAAVELVETRNYKNIEVSLLDRKDGKIKPVASSGLHPEREWEVTTDGSGDAPKCVKEAVKNTSTQLVNDPEKYCTDCKYIDENEYHDTLLVPITHRSELTGIISACHRSGRKLSKEEVELLEGMGRDLGLAREKIIVENKLEESEEKFKDLAKGTSLPIAIYQDEHWVYANPAAIDICGYSLEELKEMKYWEFVAPEHREMLKKQVLEKEGSESGYEIKIITKEGKKKWVYLTESDIDYKDEPAGLISVIDITEKKEKEGELQKTEEELKKNKKRRKLEDFAVEMESIDDEEKLYRLTVEAAKRILNFEICSLDIVEDGEFEVKATIGDVREKGTRYPIEGLAGKSYRKGESLLIKDIEEEEDAKTKRESYRSAIGVPVGDFGVFTVWSEQKGDFDENDLELAETLVHHTEVVLNRIKGEEKLRKTEERYRRLFETAQDGMLIIDAETGMIEDANPFIQDILGYSKEELIGKELWELGTFESIVENKRRFEELVEEGYIRYEDKPLVTKDGEEVPVEFVSNSYQVGGKKVVQCNIREISERKEYQEELKRKERYLDHTPEFINIIDEKGEIKYQSSPSHGIEGIDPSKVVGSKGVEFVHPDDKEEIQEMFSKVLENPGKEYRTELRGETEDGWVWFEVRAINHLDDPEIDGIIVTSRDISKRKETEEELMKSEKKFRNIFENLGDPVIIKKLGGKDHGNILDTNRAMSDMLGYSSEEFIEMNVYDDIAVGDPKELSWDEVKEKLKEGDRTEFTVKKRKKDGSEVWVEVVVVPMEYEGKNAALAVNRNITKRERRKSELQERIKELDCLYTVSNLTQKPDMTVESILQEIVDNIPPGFSYPEDTSARITFDDQSYKSESFEESSHSLSQDFSTEYGSGEIEVYVDKKGDSEDVFLEEEKELLNSITIHLENFIERKESQQELERIEWMLSKKQVASTAGKDSSSFQDQGYGDLTDLNDDGIILQSLGKDLLNDITSEYLDLLETSSAIYEKNGDYAFGIFSSGWCKFMDRQSRKLCDTDDNAAALNSGEWLCHESCWTDCSKKAIAKQEPVDIECNGGIQLYAVPIFAGGEVIGAINFGYGTPPKDPEELQELAEKYNVNYEELVEEANRYNPRPDFIIEMAKKRLHASARLIGTLVERKQAESALEENKNKIKRLHEISAEIQTCDSEEDVYSLAIEAAEDILDFDICSFDGVEGDMFVPKEISSSTPESGSTERQIDERSLGSKTYLNQESYLVDNLTSDKDAKPVKSEYRSAISVPIGEHGVFQAVSKDVGHFEEEDLKTAELLISHVSEALDRIQAKEKEEFLHSLLRHDVGNKNQIIKGYLELMKDHNLPDEVKDFVDKAERTTKDSTKIIEKVRKLREIEEEKEIDEVDLSSVIDKVLSEHQNQLQERNINLDLSECDCKVEGGELLEELFSNLVKNSIQHSDSDEIRISSQIEKNECIVTVEDDGIGISDESKEKVFEKGFKDGESAGTGLGLYMVKEIAESYGGSAEVKDSDMGGARFEVELRRARKG